MPTSRFGARLFEIERSMNVSSAPDCSRSSESGDLNLPAMSCAYGK
jgi:hypothetical protein